MLGPHGSGKLLPTSEEDHVSQQAIANIHSAISAATQDIESSRPIRFWIEFASPYDPHQFIDALMRDDTRFSTSEVWERFGQERRLFTPWMEAEIRSGFEDNEDYMELVNKNGEQLLATISSARSESFSSKLQEEINKLREEGRTISIEMERPSVDGWIAYLSQIYFRQVVNDHLSLVRSSKDETKGREHLLTAAWAMYNNIVQMDANHTARDKPYALRIAQASQRRPDELQIVIRGSGHMVSMGDALERNGISHQHTIYLPEMLEQSIEVPLHRRYVELGRPNLNTDTVSENGRQLFNEILHLLLSGSESK